MVLSALASIFHKFVGPDPADPEGLVMKFPGVRTALTVARAP